MRKRLAINDDDHLLLFVSWNVKLTDLTPSSTHFRILPAFAMESGSPHNSDAVAGDEEASLDGFDQHQQGDGVSGYEDEYGGEF